MNSPHDPAFEEHLRGGSDLSRHYRDLPADDVPPELDTRVLARAREEIDQTKRVRVWRKWTPPFALAASVLLAFSILLHLGVEREADVTAQAPLTQSDPTPAAANQASKSEGQVVPQAPAALSEPASVPSKPMRALPAPSLFDQDAASASVSINPEPKFEEPRQRLQRPAPAVRMEARSAAPAPNMAFRVDSEQSKEQIENEAPPAVSSSLGAVQADELKKAAQSINADDVVERWLIEIRKLRTAGNTAAADREWQKFRETFPDYEVAEDDAARPALDSSQE